MNAVAHIDYLLEFIQDLLGISLLLWEYGPDPVQYFQSTPRLHELFLGVLQTHLQEVAELLVDGLDDLGIVILKRDNFFRLPNFLAEPGVVGAFFVPDGFVGPSVDHREPLHEEDAQVF